ncbi:hypothetical protein [Arthrobacter pascens]|uniref:hypothetical protein n=1 Tax=Arthrobacter pascens TaxID=1677 RepID=UPI00196ADD11|nr:hypothetical protein [Arthrobacter pascens]MBN3498847.1 hypothetical protein [Arthrobacter pascens]
MRTSLEVPGLFSRPDIPDAHFSLVEFSAWGPPPGVSLLYYLARVLTPVTHAIIALPIFVGAAIGVLVIVFKAGERFQNEADGLI